MIIFSAQLMNMQSRRKTGTSLFFGPVPALRIIKAMQVYTVEIPRGIAWKWEDEGREIRQNSNDIFLLPSSTLRASHSIVVGSRRDVIYDAWTCD